MGHDPSASAAFSHGLTHAQLLALQQHHQQQQAAAAQHLPPGLEEQQQAALQQHELHAALQQQQQQQHQAQAEHQLMMGEHGGMQGVSQVGPCAPGLWSCTGYFALHA